MRNATDRMGVDTSRDRVDALPATFGLAGFFRYHGI
jgi:hypothetical protein